MEFLSFWKIQSKLKDFWGKHFGQTHKNLFYVFSSSIISKIFGATTTFLLPNLLGPTNYGAWITLLLISSYAPIFHLGVLEALFKQYPYYIGKSEYRRAKELEGNVYCFILIAASIFILAGLLIINLNNNEIIIAFRTEADLVVVTSALSLISSYQYFRISAYQKFKYCSIIDAARSIITSVVVIVLTIIYDLYGTVLGYLVSEFIILLISHVFGKIHCGEIILSLNFKVVKGAIQKGFPITFVTWVGSIVATLDRIISTTFLGKTMTGYYGLGLSAVGLLSQIPRTINSVLYPKINEELGKNSKNIKIAYLVILPSYVAGIILPLFVGCSIQVLPIIYIIFFPKYISGLSSAQILLICFYFGSLASSATNFLIAKAYNLEILISILVNAGIGASLTIFLIHQQFNLIALAVGSLTAAVSQSVVVWTLVFRNFDFNKTEKNHFFAVFYIPAIIMSCLCLLSNIVTPLLIDNIIYGAIINSIFFILSYFLIFTAIRPFKDWRKSVIAEIRDSFVEKGKNKFSFLK